MAEPITIIVRSPASWRTSSRQILSVSVVFSTPQEIPEFFLLTSLFGFRMLESVDSIPWGGSRFLILSVGPPLRGKSMKFVNIDTTILQEPEFTAASLKQVGIWFKLYAYCVLHENRGLINSTGSWSDTHCKRILGCSRKDLDHSPLWSIRESGQLNLYHYNLIAESFSIKRKKTQRLAASARSEAKTLAARENGSLGGRPKGTRKIVPILHYQQPESAS